jgi:hypothetical protein
MSLIEHCECGKTLTEAERLVGPVIVERDRWRESARVSEDEILRLRDQLAGAVDRIAELEAALRWAHPAPDRCPTRANRSECPACDALTATEGQ